MTTLFIQIPCYNEEETLGITLDKLPRNLPGIDKIAWLVVDDGSTDRTASVAREKGVDYVVSHAKNRGLATAFLTGIEVSTDLGADIILNTDADNQYCAEDIPKLIQPILDGKAEIVIGARHISEIEHFSMTKKCLQKIGSCVVRFFSNTDVPDAPSGFRAMSRDAAMRLNVFNKYTYTLETIIQAGQKGMSILSVPIRTNQQLRSSRLVKSIPRYILKSVETMIRIFMTYRPLRFFAVPGFLSFTTGLLIALRYIYFFLTKSSAGHIQSLILAALLMGIGFFLLVIGLIADLIAVNRILLEKLDWRIRKIEGKIGSK